MRLYKRIQKVISGVLCLMLAVTQVSMQTAQAAPLENDLPNVSAFAALDPFKLKIPAVLGKVEEAFTAHDGQTVILIQDAHAIEDAQKNIQKLIAFFQEEYGISHVAVEGASQVLEPQIFKSFPDSKKLKSVFKNYLQRGELTGASAAALFNPRRAEYEGVENWDLYETGYRAYLNAAAARPEIESRLEAWNQSLNERKASAYSAELLRVDQAWNRFLEGEGDLTQTLQLLAKILPPEPESELALILEESRRKGDDVAVTAEVRWIAGKIRSRTVSLAPDQQKEFEGKFQDFQTDQINAQSYALYLKDFILAAPVLRNQLAQTDPKILSKLSGFSQTARRLEAIEGTRFFRDFIEYSKRVKTLLIKNEEQRSLDRETEQFALLKRFSELKLDQEDWEKISKEDGKKFNTENSSAAELSPLFKDHFAFYENAKARDGVMLENVLKILARKKGALKINEPEPADETFQTEKRQPASRSSLILIAGGFHTHGMTRLLKEKGISYAVIMPAIKSIPEKTGYEDQMLGRVSWSSSLKVENGVIDLNAAFIRGTRDKLLEDDPRVLKNWRDEIIRDLADQGKIERSGEYTRFIDELVKPESTDSFKRQWIQNIQSFMKGMRGLEERGELNSQSVIRLLSHPSVLNSPVTANAFASRSEIRGFALEKGRIFNSRAQGIPAEVLKSEVTRSEVRQTTPGAVLPAAYAVQRAIGHLLDTLQGQGIVPAADDLNYYRQTLGGAAILPENGTRVRLEASKADALLKMLVKSLNEQSEVNLTSSLQESSRYLMLDYLQSELSRILVDESLFLTPRENSPLKERLIEAISAVRTERYQIDATDRKATVSEQQTALDQARLFITKDRETAAFIKAVQLLQQNPSNENLNIALGYLARPQEVPPLTDAEIVNYVQSVARRNYFSFIHGGDQDVLNSNPFYRAVKKLETALKFRGQTSVSKYFNPGRAHYLRGTSDETGERAATENALSIIAASVVRSEVRTKDAEVQGVRPRISKIVFAGLLSMAALGAQLGHAEDMAITTEPTPTLAEEFINEKPLELSPTPMISLLPPASSPMSSKVPVLLPPAPAATTAGSLLTSVQNQLDSSPALTKLRNAFADHLTRGAVSKREEVPASNFVDHVRPLRPFPADGGGLPAAVFDFPTNAFAGMAGLETYIRAETLVELSSDPSALTQGVDHIFILEGIPSFIVPKTSQSGFITMHVIVSPSEVERIQKGKTSVDFDVYLADGPDAETFYKIDTTDTARILSLVRYGAGASWASTGAYFLQRYSTQLLALLFTGLMFLPLRMLVKKVIENLAQSDSEDQEPQPVPEGQTRAAIREAIRERMATARSEVRQQLIPLGVPLDGVDSSEVDLAELINVTLNLLRDVKGREGLKEWMPLEKRQIAQEILEKLGSEERAFLPEDRGFGLMTVKGSQGTGVRASEQLERHVVVTDALVGLGAAYTRSKTHSKAVVKLAARYAWAILSAEDRLMRAVILMSDFNSQAAFSTLKEIGSGVSLTAGELDRYTQLNQDSRYRLHQQLAVGLYNQSASDLVDFYYGLNNPAIAVIKQLEPSLAEDLSRYFNQTFARSEVRKSGKDRPEGTPDKVWKSIAGPQVNADGKNPFKQAFLGERVVFTKAQELYLVGRLLEKYKQALREKDGEGEDGAAGRFKMKQGLSNAFLLEKVGDPKKTVEMYLEAIEAFYSKDIEAFFEFYEEVTGEKLLLAPREQFDSGDQYRDAVEAVIEPIKEVVQKRVERWLTGQISGVVVVDPDSRRIKETSKTITVNVLRDLDAQRVKVLTYALLASAATWVIGNYSYIIMAFFKVQIAALLAWSMHGVAAAGLIAFVANYYLGGWIKNILSRIGSALNVFSRRQKQTHLHEFRLFITEERYAVYNSDGEFVRDWHTDVKDFHGEMKAIRTELTQAAGDQAAEIHTALLMVEKLVLDAFGSTPWYPLAGKNGRRMINRIAEIHRTLLEDSKRVGQDGKLVIQNPRLTALAMFYSAVSELANSENVEADFMKRWLPPMALMNARTASVFQHFQRVYSQIDPLLNIHQFIRDQAKRKVPQNHLLTKKVLKGAQAKLELDDFLNADLRFFDNFSAFIENTMKPKAADGTSVNHGSKDTVRRALSAPLYSAVTRRDRLVKLDNSLAGKSGVWVSLIRRILRSLIERYDRKMNALIQKIEADEKFLRKEAEERHAVLLGALSINEDRVTDLIEKARKGLITASHDYITRTLHRQIQWKMLLDRLRQSKSEAELAEMGLTTAELDRLLLKVHRGAYQLVRAYVQIGLDRVSARKTESEKKELELAAQNVIRLFKSQLLPEGSRVPIMGNEGRDYGKDYAAIGLFLVNPKLIGEFVEEYQKKMSGQRSQAKTEPAVRGRPQPVDYGRQVENKIDELLDTPAHQAAQAAAAHKRIQALAGQAQRAFEALSVVPDDVLALPSVEQTALLRSYASGATNTLKFLSGKITAEQLQDVVRPFLSLHLSSSTVEAEGTSKKARGVRNKLLSNFSNTQRELMTIVEAAEAEILARRSEVRTFDSSNVLDDLELEVTAGSTARLDSAASDTSLAFGSEASRELQRILSQHANLVTPLQERGFTDEQILGMLAISTSYTANFGFLDELSEQLKAIGILVKERVRERVRKVRAGESTDKTIRIVTEGLGLFPHEVFNMMQTGVPESGVPDLPSVIHQVLQEEGETSGDWSIKLLSADLDEHALQQANRSFPDIQKAVQTKYGSSFKEVLFETVSLNFWDMEGLQQKKKSFFGDAGVDLLLNRNASYLQLYAGGLIQSPRAEKKDHAGFYLRSALTVQALMNVFAEAGTILAVEPVELNGRDGRETQHVVFYVPGTELVVPEARNQDSSGRLTLSQRRLGLMVVTEEAFKEPFSIDTLSRGVMQSLRPAVKVINLNDRAAETFSLVRTRGTNSSRRLWAKRNEASRRSEVRHETTIPVKAVKSALRDAAYKNRETSGHFDLLSGNEIISLSAQERFDKLEILPTYKIKQEFLPQELKGREVIDVGGSKFVLVKASSLPGAIVTTTSLYHCSGVTVEAVLDGELYYGVGHIFHSPRDGATFEGDIGNLLGKLQALGFKSQDITWFLTYEPASYGLAYGDDDGQILAEDQARQNLGINIWYQPREGGNGETLLVDQNGFTVADGILPEPVSMSWAEMKPVQAGAEAETETEAETADASRSEVRKQLSAVLPEVVVTAVSREVRQQVVKETAARLKPGAVRSRPMTERTAGVLIQLNQNSVELEAELLAQMDVIEVETFGRFSAHLAQIRGSIKPGYVLALQVSEGLDEGVMKNFMRSYLNTLSGSVSQMLTDGKGMKGALLEEMREKGITPRRAQMDKEPIFVETEGLTQTQVPFLSFDGKAVQNTHRGFSLILLDFLNDLKEDPSLMELVSKAGNAEALGELMATIQLLEADLEGNHAIEAQDPVLKASELKQKLLIKLMLDEDLLESLFDPKTPNRIKINIRGVLGTVIEQMAARSEVRKSA